MRVLKGVYRGSIVGFYDIEALLVRIGFGGILFFSYNKEPQNPISIIKALTLSTFCCNDKRRGKQCQKLCSVGHRELDFSGL